LPTLYSYQRKPLANPEHLDQDRASGPPISQSRSGSMIYKIQPFPEDLTTDLSSLDKNTKLITLNPERGLVRVWDQEDSRFSLAVVSDAPIGLLFAQDMFSSFMWAVAKTASREQMAHLMGPATVQKAEDVTSTENAAWKSFTLKNPILSKLVQGIQRTGLGSQEEIYLSIIPPLSANGKLPDPTAVVQSAREEAKKQELAGQLQRAGEVYLWTLHACMSFGHKHTVAIEASIAMTEFIRSISITAQDREHQSRIVESSKRLKEIRSRLAAVLIQSSSPPVLDMLARMYDLQCRDEGCDEWMLKTNTIFPNFHTLDLLDSDLLCRTKLHEAVIRGEERLAHFQEHYASVYYNHLKTKDIFGWTPLHYAARLGDQKSFDMLLQSHADVNSTDIAGWTPLHYIIWARCVQPDIWRSLRQYNVNLNAQGQDGLAPLHCAAIRNDVRMARHLIKRRAKVGILDNKRRTPLHWAAFCGSGDMVKLLCKDVYLDLPDEYGRTPLHLAAAKGHEHVIKILSSIPDAGGDIRDHDGMTPVLLAAKGLHEDAVKAFLGCGTLEYGFTALHVAVQGGYFLLVKELLTAGADKEALTMTGFTALHLASRTGDDKIIKMLLQSGANKNARDINNRTALHMATICEHWKAMEVLLSAGIDTEAQDNQSCTALHWAISEGFVDTMEMLLEYPGTDLEDKNGWTVLHRAVISGDHEILTRLLLKTCVKKDATDVDGNTALYLACERGNENAVETLVIVGANLEIPNIQGWKAIHTAAAQGNKSIELLLNAGAEKDTPNTSGLTPLHLAIQGIQDEHELVVQILLDSGANIEVKDVNQRTLLHWAAEIGSRSIETLLKTEMDTNARDKEESTPLHLAILSKHGFCVQKLLDSGADIEAVDIKKRTPLHLAARGGYASGVSMLLNRADRERRDKDGYTPLHWAVKKGNIEIVELFMEVPLDKGSRNTKGYTALHLAAQGGNQCIFDILASRGWDIESQDRKYWTPLHWAAYNGHDLVIQSLLKVGVNKDARDKEGLTPLHQAAKSGHPLVIKTLIKAGMDTEVEDIVGRTPLHLAATRGEVQSIEVLLQGKAQCNAKDNLMSTPLQHAAFHGKDEAIRALLCAGADIALIDQDGTALHYAAHKGHQSTVQVLLENGADPNEVNMNQWSASHLAAFGGHIQVLEVLAKSKANFRAKNKDGSTPLHMALRGRHMDVVKAILGWGTEATTAELHYAAYIGNPMEIERLYNSGVYLQLTDAAGLTALHHAASNGHDGALAKLLELGAYTSSKDIYGHTPLFEAAANSRYGCLKILIDKGAEVDSQSIVGWTALHYASYGGKDLIAKTLLQSRADTEIKTNNGETALNLACDVGHESVVRVLLVAGANVNPRDGSGWTALHGAVHGGHLELLKALIEAKVDLNATLKDGSTAFHVAAFLGHLEVVKTLRKAGVDVWALNLINGWTALEYATSSKSQEMVDFLLSEDVVSPDHVKSRFTMPENDSAIEPLFRQGLELRADWRRKICGGEEEERGKRVLKHQVRVVL
jgi:ankyrin repeat protein